MPDEEDQRDARTALGCPQEGVVAFGTQRQRGGNELAHAGTDTLLVQTLGRDVHELQGARGEALREGCHGASVPSYFRW